MLRLRRPGPALGVALIALLIALGGTSMAAVSVVLPDGSVGTQQLKNDSVTRAKIAHESITSLLVKDGSLLAGDFVPGQLPAGPQGPAGPKGDKGDTGVIGAVRTLTESIVVPASATPNDGKWETRSVTQEVPAGYKAIGAGTGWSSASNTDALMTVYMKPVLDSSGNAIGYHARGGNDTATARTFTLYVLAYKG
jgi:hypothetical protein